MKNITHVLGLLIFVTLFSCNNEKLLLPEITSKWWQVTTTYPDITPYNYTKGDNKVCDFTIFQADDGTWQLIACIRGNDYPGAQRFLYRWETASLTDTLWQEKGVFLATGYGDETDGFGFIYDSSHYPAVGKLQAPHCIKKDGLYYLFYNNDNAHCLVSKDGKNFEPLKNDAGSLTFFEMGRDVMIFKDKNSSQWIAYYTNPNTNPQSMAARSCSTLTGEWSQETIIFDGHSDTRSPVYRNEFAESPFVINYGKDYYLFAQMLVFHSTDPLKFETKVATLESTLYEKRCWSPEIIEDNSGQLYIAAYRPNGIWMARIEFK